MMSRDRQTGLGGGCALAFAFATGFLAPALAVPIAMDMQGAAVRNSYQPAVSSTGRFVAFLSTESSLVPGDTNRGVDVGSRTLSGADVFVRDRFACSTERASVTDVEAEALGESWGASISDDGRYVAFSSDAANLWPPGSSDRRVHVYRRDRILGATRLISANASGAPGDFSSGDLLSSPSISASGSRVAFASYATNLVPSVVLTGDYPAIFVADTELGLVAVVSLNDAGQAVPGYHGQPALSGDGNAVAFLGPSALMAGGSSTDGEALYLRDILAGHTRRVNVDAAGTLVPNPGPPRVSRDGCLVSFVGGGSAWLFDCAVGYAAPIAPTIGEVVHIAADGATLALLVAHGVLGSPGPGYVSYATLSGAVVPLAPPNAVPVDSSALSSDGRVLATSYPVGVFGVDVPTLCEDTALCAGAPIDAVEAAACRIKAALSHEGCGGPLPRRVVEPLRDAFVPLELLRREGEPRSRPSLRRSVASRLREAAVGLRHMRVVSMGDRQCRRDLRRELRLVRRALKLA